VKQDAYTLDRFVADLRRISRESADEKQIISTLRPLVRQFALSGTWVEPGHYEADAEQGFGAHLLHEESDHTLAVLAASWLPGRGIPPHDHGTWGVVVGVDGAENNLFWERIDDGSRSEYAELRRIGEKVFGPGDVVAMPTGTIHSVRNETDRVTLSLHVYGKHINFTPRSQFDPEQRTAKPLIVKLS
jgi:predicted metal-dependent enzyme (double-stranded beta helix superfamily)